MKLKCHLYSPNANCLHCDHRRVYGMDMDPLDHKIGDSYCSIIASDVEDDYYCSFYTLKKLEKGEKRNSGTKKL